jgi:uncharacterized protein (TIGR03435 family)
MRRAIVAFCLPALLSAAASSQSTAPARAFDNVEVHPSNPAARLSIPLSVMFEGGPQSLHMSPGRFEATAITLRRLIAMAYDVKDSAVIGGGKWLETERFDVTAQSPPTASSAAVQPILRTMLAKTFNLAVHNEVRPVRVFALKLAKRNPKLTPAPRFAPSRCVPVESSRVGQNNAITVRNYTYTCHATTMAQLAERLPAAASEELHLPMVDLTGLTGAYDFVLSWSVPLDGEDVIDRQGPGGQAPWPHGLSVIDSLGDLGLKLAVQERSMPVLVVDHVNRPPAH